MRQIQRRDQQVDIRSYNPDLYIEVYDEETDRIILVRRSDFEAPQQRHRFDARTMMFYVALALIAFGFGGQDIAYLAGVATIVLGSAAVGWGIYRGSGNYLAGILGGCLSIAIIVGTDMVTRVYANTSSIAYALQHLSWIGVGILGILFLQQLKSR